MHWMNSGEGAHLRHQDRMLQTGQWALPSSGQADQSWEEHRTREAEAERTRSSFLETMAAAGNPGSQGFPRYPDLAREVRCWKVAETTEQRPDVTEAKYQRDVFLTTTNELCYLDAESIKRRFRRMEMVKVLRVLNGWVGISPIAIADRCRKIAAEQGIEILT